MTDRQRQALHLLFIECKTQVETAEEMGGITQEGVHYHLQGALKRIVKIYDSWDYGEIEVVFNENDEDDEMGEI